MTDKKTAAYILGTKGWFARLPQAMRDDILRRSFLRSFREGQSIIVADDPPGGMHGVVSGSVKVLFSHSQDGPRVAHVGQPGFWFGLGAAAVREPRRNSVLARRDATTLYLPAMAINEMVRADPSTWRMFTLNVILNLDTAMRANSDLLIRDPRARIGAILLRLAGLEMTPSNSRDATDIDITHAELAEISGLSRSGLGRILARLETGGMIDVGYGRISLLRPKAISELTARGK